MRRKKKEKGVKPKAKQCSCTTQCMIKEKCRVPAVRPGEAKCRRRCCTEQKVKTDHNTERRKSQAERRDRKILQRTGVKN